MAKAIHVSHFPWVWLFRVTINLECVWAICAENKSRKNNNITIKIQVKQETRHDVIKIHLLHEGHHGEPAMGIFRIIVIAVLESSIPKTKFISHSRPTYCQSCVVCREKGKCVVWATCSQWYEPLVASGMSHWLPVAWATGCQWHEPLIPSGLLERRQFLYMSCSVTQWRGSCTYGRLLLTVSFVSCFRLSGK